MVKKILQSIVYAMYKRQLRSLGKGTKINPTSEISRKHLISIGDYSFIGKQCHISIVEPSSLYIGNYVGISPYVKILGGDRNLFTVGKRYMTISDPINVPIRIEDDTMIGMDAMILKGVTIGEGAIVGAKSLVHRSVLPYTIVAGNPAKMLKLRFQIDDLKIHLDAVGSQYKIDDLIAAYDKHGLLPR